MFVLDTDHIGVIQRATEPEYSRLADRIQKHRSSDFHVSVVSFHEQVSGWNAYIQRARTRQAVVRAYRMFQCVLSDFAVLQVLPFDEDAAERYESLRRQGVRVGTMDLRIAATALSRGFTVLTRNLTDFKKIPGAVAEDWCLP